MQQEQHLPQSVSPGQAPEQGGSDVGQLHAEAAELLAAADRVLNAIVPVDAESYLQHNRQRGGE